MGLVINFKKCLCVNLVGVDKFVLEKFVEFFFVFVEFKIWIWFDYFLVFKVLVK